MYNDRLLSTRIDALELTAEQNRIQKAMTGFVVVEPLDIGQLKQHAHLFRKKLQAQGVMLKTTHSQELVACVYGFRNWQAAIAGLKC